MKGKILKYLNENTPESIKKILSKKIRNKVIKNEAFLAQITEIKRFEQLSKEEKEKIHFNKTKEMLIYAYENTKYYKEIFDNIGFDPYNMVDLIEMKKIPIINKEIVLKNFEKLVSKENIDYYEAFTGGSSGKPLKILLDTSSIYKEKGFVYSYWKKFGYDYRNSRIVTLRGLEFKNRIYKYNPIDNQIILNPFMLSEMNINQYVKKINEFKPEFIHGYASAIKHLCKLIESKKCSLKIKLKGICFVSENIEQEDKIYIENILKCKSNIFYGHSERIVFAEYIENGYEFNKLYTHVELINREDDISDIACTGLVNKKMPLIRYVPDDKIILKDNKIQIYGHWDKEVLIGKNNEKISMAAINFHNNVFSKIRQYQFEQNDIGIVILKIIENNKLSRKDLDKIQEILMNKLEGILEIKIEITKELKLTKRGKLKKIIQNLNLK